MAETWMRTFGTNSDLTSRQASEEEETGLRGPNAMHLALARFAGPSTV